MGHKIFLFSRSLHRLKFNENTQKKETKYLKRLLVPEKRGKKTKTKPIKMLFGSYYKRLESMLRASPMIKGDKYPTMTSAGEIVKRQISFWCPK